MEWDLVFFTNSLLLGVGLAMDAFSVSMANGLRQPEMSRGQPMLRRRSPPRRAAPPCAAGRRPAPQHRL